MFYCDFLTTPDSSLALHCSHQVSPWSCIKVDFVNLRKTGLLKFFPRESMLHLERNQSSDDIDPEPPLLLYTWMNNLIFFSHASLLGQILASSQGLHDILTWPASDGRGGLTSECRLTCSVGNRSVFLPSLSDASGLLPVTWPRLCVAHLHPSHGQHLPLVMHQYRLSVFEFESAHLVRSDGLCRYCRRAFVCHWCG